MYVNGIHKDKESKNETFTKTKKVKMEHTHR